MSFFDQIAKSGILPDAFDPKLVDDHTALPENLVQVLRELVWRKCAANPIWFVQNFWHIPVVGKGYVIPKLRPYQIEDADWMDKGMTMDRFRGVVLKARQIGWTTIGMGLVFHSAWFHIHRPWVIASQGEDEAKDTLKNKIKAGYSLLPLWMRDRGPQATNDNSEQIDFDNGSTIYSVAATGSAGRSKAVFGAMLDEFAFVQDGDALLTAIDPMVYGPLFVFSTANGMGNAFHDKWLDSELPDSEWDGRFRSWQVVPERDQKWYDREKRKFRGKEHLFYQEHPSTPTEAFSKSGRTPISVELLKEQSCFCEPQLRLDMARLDFELPISEQLAGLASEGVNDLDLWVWAEPTIERSPIDNAVLRAPNYVVFADVSEGLEHADRSSIVVLDANSGEEVAALRGYVPVEDLGDILYRIGEWYHWALVAPERNNHGLLPVDTLRRMMYPRLFRMDSYAQIPTGRTPRYGWITNRGTKPRMVNDFIKGLKDGHFMMHDARLLEEASTFISDGKGGYGATAGKHDDHVIGHLGAYQLVLDVGSYPIIWKDTSGGPTTWNDVLEALGRQMRSSRPGSVMDKPIGGGNRIDGSRPSIFV